MPLKFIVSKLEEVAEAFRGEYAQQSDGTFRLKTEGEIPEVVAALAKVAEFRDNNIGLNKKVTELETSLKSYEGVDPLKFKEYKSRVEDLEKNGGVKTAEEIGQRISKAVSEAVTPLQEKLTQMETDKRLSDEKLAKTKIENALRGVASKAGVADSAMEDFVTRGMRVFDLEGRPMNGDTPIWSKKDPSKPMPMDEWAGQLSIEAPHLFKPSGGGGARNGGQNGPGAGHGNSQKVISGSDVMEVGRNLEAIAKGEVRVVRDSQSGG